MLHTAAEGETATEGDRGFLPEVREFSLNLNNL